MTARVEERAVLRRKDLIVTPHLPSVLPQLPPFDGISNRQRVSSVTEVRSLQKVIRVKKI
jgi:hypothetical protein